MKQENRMGVAPVPGLILSMSVPIMISMIVQSMYNIVDSIFVARISSPISDRPKPMPAARRCARR